MVGDSEFLYKIYTDGGSRGNPGPAAYGFVIYDSAGVIIREAKQFLGITTNNQAEYQGLAAALEAVQSLDLLSGSQIICYSDSQLMVRQINGVYKMKSDELRPWLKQIWALRDSLDYKITFVDVRREANKYADGLVNQALDEVSHG